MKRFAPALALAAALATTTPAAACLWDSDTVEQETAGSVEAIAAVVGGFARNPPKYYEMRLARAEKAIAAKPNDYAAYDDAGVSCDRLGRHDEALGWMKKKAAAMEKAGYLGTISGDPRKDHRYRLLANLGTFHVHGWFKAGAKFDDVTPLEKGRDAIKAALERNPKAHFGREKFQLKAIEWLLTKPKHDPKKGWPAMLPIGDEHTHTSSDKGHLKKLGLEGAPEGLAGLMALGAAWQSVDVVHALELSLMAQGKHSVAQLARLRGEEIANGGGKSVVAGTPTGKGLADAFPHTMVQDKDGLKKHYKKLRQAAEAWHKRRTAYLEKALAEGRHPDTHSDFWKAFGEDPWRMDVRKLPSGCGCHLADRPDPRPSLAWLAALAALAIRRRRS